MIPVSLRPSVRALSACLIVLVLGCAKGTQGTQIEPPDATTEADVVRADGGVKGEG